MKLNESKGSVSYILEQVLKYVRLFMVVHRKEKRRAGTENVPGIVGIGKATERAISTMKERTAKKNRIERLSD